jgi:hypothetical protein
MGLKHRLVRLIRGIVRYDMFDDTAVHGSTAYFLATYAKDFEERDRNSELAF